MNKRRRNSAEIEPFKQQLIGDSSMGPAYFVIAILGCADGGTSCTPVATLQTRYQSAAECSAATTEALEANSNFDFPTLLARCRRGAVPTSLRVERDRPLPVRARRG